MKICHLSSAHNKNDIRIFIKECSSLAKVANYELHYLVFGEKVEKYIKNNVNVHVFKKNHKNRLQRMTKSVSIILKEALLIDADVYHFHDPELLPVGNKLKKKGKKVIYDAHEDLPRAIMSKHWIPKLLRKSISYIFERYENSISRKMDYVITATPHIGNRFSAINQKTYVINNYPLLEELKNNNDVERLSQVCYLGGLSSIRGLEELIDVSKKIKVPLVIAGPISGNEAKKRIDSEKNINYLGIIDREEAAYLLASSIAGIVTFLPEPNHINSQPNKLFEYMSASLPIIGSNFPLWKEIIENNKCGICVNPLSVNDITDAINNIVADINEAEKMGRNGRKAVEEKYNWEQEEKKLLKIYEELLFEKETIK